jgi:hypothetical protein
MVDAMVPVVLLPDDSDENEGGNYVFQVEEFESENFNATNFFVKYKTVYGCTYHISVVACCIVRTAIYCCYCVSLL